ncbi:Uncharacterised protein [Klebsiella aerogenes]|nr:Uncharacterised protein [Klebsiella aerogenes]
MCGKGPLQGFIRSVLYPPRHQRKKTIVRYVHFISSWPYKNIRLWHFLWNQ